MHIVSSTIKVYVLRNYMSSACLLTIQLSQKMSGAFEAQGKHVSDQRGITSKPLKFGTAVLADQSAEEESQRAISFAIPSVSPSLQASRVESVP